jgi:hypothetical protein
MLARDPATGEPRLWAAHNMELNSSGTATNYGDRIGSVWYELSALGGTPSITQRGVLFDPGGTNPDNYWVPAIAANGQGHAVVGSSVAGLGRFASVALNQRFYGEAAGTLSPTTIPTGAAGADFYKRLDTQNRNRWGDYSGASPDPNGEGIWVVGEFAAATQNTWGAQVGLTYQTSPPPANDPFSGSQFISGTSVSAGGTNRYATWQPGEPGSNSSTHSVWYRWTAPFSGPVTMDTCTSSFDTVLDVYTGFAVNGLTQVASNDDTTGCGTGTGSKVAFNATSGTTYQILVDGFSGQQGTFTFHVIDKAPPKVMSTTPANNVTGVVPGANVIATFSEAMQGSSVNTTTFKLKKAGTTTFLGATVTYDPATKRATLNPNNNLQSGVTYVATVTTGAKDLAGNALDQNPTTAGNQAKTWTFKVG